MVSISIGSSLYLKTSNDACACWPTSVRAILLLKVQLRHFLPTRSFPCVRRQVRDSSIGAIIDTCAIVLGSAIASSYLECPLRSFPFCFIEHPWRFSCILARLGRLFRIISHQCFQEVWTQSRNPLMHQCRIVPEILPSNGASIRQITSLLPHVGVLSVRVLVSVLTVLRHQVLMLASWNPQSPKAHSCEDIAETCSSRATPCNVMVCKCSGMSRPMPQSLWQCWT